MKELKAGSLKNSLCFGNQCSVLVFLVFQLHTSVDDTQFFFLNFAHWFTFFAAIKC